MTAPDAIEIELVAQVVQVEFQIDVICQRIRRHGVKRPIRVNNPAINCVPEAAIDEARAAAEV